MLTAEAEYLLSKSKYNEAIRLCLQAQSIYKSQDNEGGLAWVDRILGDIYSASSNNEHAERKYTEGLELRSRLYEAGYTAADTFHLAEFYLYKLHDLDRAIYYFEKSEQEYRLVDTGKADEIKEKINHLRSPDD